VFDPASGFGGLEFELGDGLDGVAAGEDGEVFGVELLAEGLRAGERTVRFFVETGGDGFDGGRQDGVVGGVGLGDGEAVFDGGPM